MKKFIAVYCGSATGNKPIFAQQAQLLGKELVNNGYGLVYGGACVGLMGVVADAVLDAGGEVIGVIPEFLQTKELEHRGISALHVVNTMAERKEKMDELCDGVVALPGGFGTLDEYFEMLTLGQLSRHKKPIALLNTDNYYNPLIAMVENMITNGFLKDEYRSMFLVDNDVSQLISKMMVYIAPANEKWLIPATSK